MLAQVTYVKKPVITNDANHGLNVKDYYPRNQGHTPKYMVPNHVFMVN